MANKRVFKVATASAVAASALVAAVPASAASVTYEQAEKQVNVAREAANGLHAEYTKNADYKTKVDIKEANDELNRAKAKIAALSDAKQKAYLSSRIQGTIDTVARANAYNNAVRVGTEILPAAHQAVVKAADVASLKEGNVLLAAKIKQAKETFPKVYGKEIQAKFASLYLTADLEADRKDGHYAAITADRVAEGLKLIAAGKVEEAEVQYKNAEASFKAVKGLATIKEIIAADWTELGKKIEAAKIAKVESVSAINAKELQIKFNQPVDEASVIDNSDDLIAGIVMLNSVDARTLTDNAYLSADGKTLTLVATTTWNGSYAAEVVDEKIETLSGKKVAEYKAFVSVNDTTRPTFSGVSYEPSGLAKFSFSEPLDETAASIASKLVVAGPTSVTVTGADIVLSADKKSFTVALPGSMTKDASYTFTFTGLKDFAGNLLSPNPVSTSVVKADRDTVKPTVTSVVALDTGKVQVTFSEKVRANTAVVTVGGADYTTYTLDTTGTIATFTGVTNLTAGVQSVTVKDALDLAGLELDDVSRVIQVSADTTAPAYVNHTVETVGADRFLVVNYNEEITANQAVSVTGTYVDSNSITQTVTAITGTNITRGSDKKSVRIKLPTTAGTYTLNLPTGLAEDTSAATNDSASRSVSFTLGTAVDPTKPVLSTFGQSGNKVTVTFDRDVTAATALNVNNYTIDGISAPFQSAIFVGNARTVELTLKNDVVITNGVRNYTVSNVATSAGSVMVSLTDKYDFSENVRPVVQGAKVISANQIEVTLSEAIDSATVGTDFDVFQGASTTALADSEAISGTNKVIITLTAPLDSLTGLSLKASSTIDLTDLKGNNVNFVGPITVTN